MLRWLCRFWEKEVEMFEIRNNTTEKEVRICDLFEWSVGIIKKTRNATVSEILKVLKKLGLLSASEIEVCDAMCC